MEDPLVSIIILNYNGKQFLHNCLFSVENQTYKKIETLVVDNASQDASFECVSDFPWARLVKNEENYGYAKGNNRGVGSAKGEFLLILNNDTELFPDMIEKLVRSYEEKSIVAPAQILMVNKETDQVGWAGSGMDIFGFPYADRNPKKTKLFYSDGSAIFLKKKDFVDLGMFDEALFMFQEDIDFSWRAQMRGFKIIQCWEAKYYHYSGGAAIGGGSKNTRYVTSTFRRYYNERNVIRNIIKNYTFFIAILLLPALFLIHCFEMAILCLMGQLRVAFCYPQAYYWNIVNLRETLRFRKENQEKRVVSDFKLMKRMYFRYSKLTSLYRIGLPIFK